MSSVTLNTSSAQPNIEGVCFLKVIDKDLVLQALQQILRDSPEINWSRLSDSIQKNSVIVLSKEYGASLDNFSSGAGVEDVSLTASKVSGISESFNTTNNHNVTAIGEHSFAAGKVVIINNYYNYTGEKPAQSPIGPDSNPLDPVLSASEIKAAFRALYTSENFKRIRRLVDPTKSLLISESFIRLAVVLEKEFERAQKEALDGKKADSIRNSDFVYLNSHEAIMQPKELIEVGKLFEYSDLDKLTPSRLLAVGAAGVGKSTLCQYIANTWAEHPEKLGNWKNKFDYLFLIRLRDLASYSSIPTLAEVVQKSLRDLSMKSIERILSTSRDKILFLLDGYDEVASWLTQNGERDAFFRELLRQPHWILTTRPNYFNESMGSYNCRKLEIVGFTRRDIKKYIDRFFQDSSCPERAQLVHQLLSSNARIAALSHIPINLELLCSVWKMKSAASTEPYTMTKLYGEISGFLFERYINEKLGENIQGITLNYLAGNKQYSPLLEAMENIAWKGLRNPKASVILEKKLYEPLISVIINAEGTPKDIKKTFYSALFNELGFFRTVPSFENSKHPHLVDYYFIHLTFQEYFAARYFVRKLSQSGIQGGDWKEFLNDMKFNPKFGVVLWFAAGLLGERVHDCSDSRNAAREARSALDAFIKGLISHPRSLLGTHELALAMQCSEELEGVSVPSQQQALEEFVVMLRNLVSRKMRKLREKSCVTLFQGIRKFYLLDTGQSILQTVQQGDFYCTVRVAKALQLLAPGVIDFLIKKMEDQRGDRSVRETVAGLLGEFQLEGETLEKVEEALIQRLGDDESDVWRVAARSICKLQLGEETLKKVAEALIQRLGDDDSQVRVEAAKSLGGLQSTGDTLGKVAEALIQGLGDDDSQVRVEAAKSLGGLQSTGDTLGKVEEALIQRLGDDDSQVRVEAAKSLGGLQSMGDTLGKVAEALIQRLGDDDSQVRVEAAKSLGGLQSMGDTLGKVAEALIQGLGDKDNQARLSALRSLGQLQLEGELLTKVAEALIQRLGDKDSQVRVEAAESIGGLQSKGKTPGKLAEAFIQRLGNEDSRIRSLAVKSLSGLQSTGETLGKVAEALIQTLGDERSKVRLSAVRSLRQLQLEGETLGKVAEAIIRRLGDERSKVRLSAVRSLGQIQLEGETLGKVAEVLIQILGDDDSQVRRKAAESLGMLQLEGETLGKVAEALIQILGDDDSQVRRKAAESLGKLQLEGETLAKVVEALIQRLGDDDSQVRRKAAESLGKLQLEGETLAKVVEALIQRLGDDDSQVRRKAAESLGKLQLKGETLAKVVEALIQRLGDDDSQVRSVAAESLGKLQLKGETLAKVAEALIQILGDHDSQVRRKAAESLGKFQLEWGTLANVVEALVERLGERNWEVLSAAAQSLGELQLEGETLAVVTMALIQSLGDYNRFVQYAAAQSLGELQLEGETLAMVTDFLIERLRDYRSNIRVVTAKLLGELQMDEETLTKVAEALIQRLGDADSSVRIEAAKSLGKLQPEGETLCKVAEALIQRLVGKDDPFLSALLASLLTPIDIKKTYAQIRSNEETAIKLIAYKIFHSETLCYYQEGCFYYYDQGRFSGRIEMNEADYGKLKQLLLRSLTMGL